MKVQVDAKSLHFLAERSKEAGSEHVWMDIALEWIDAADEEINRLTDKLKAQT